MPGFHVKFDIAPDEFVAHLSEAAYRVSLRRSHFDSFVDFREAIEDELREVIRHDMFVTDLCGLYTVCQEADHYEPWSAAAERVF